MTAEDNKGMVARVVGGTGESGEARQGGDNEVDAGVALTGESSEARRGGDNEVDADIASTGGSSEAG